MSAPETKPEAQATKSPEPMPFAEFLESVPPTQEVPITGLAERKAVGAAMRYVLKQPQIQLHCTNEACNGLRFFRGYGGEIVFTGNDDDSIRTYMGYICSNCRSVTKTFSIQAKRDGQTSGRCFKFGEFPSYGPPTPARLIRLFGDERETFLSGRRCENQGLGIGAFVYYRRVVENQKNKILDEVIRVSEKIGASPEMLSALKAAKEETQFSKAIKSVKDAIPQALLINGQNPLTLLHAALSGGLHEHTDANCLELAHDVRVVLVELAERLGSALKDEEELNSSVARLLKANRENK